MKRIAESALVSGTSFPREASERNAAGIVRRIRELFETGSALRVLIRKGDADLLSLPLDYTIAEARLGAVRPLWELLHAAVIKAGPDCTVTVELADGGTALFFANTGN